jgi:hypothetical protein
MLAIQTHAEFMSELYGALALVAIILIGLLLLPAPKDGE